MTERCDQCGVLTGRPHLRDCPNRLCRVVDQRGRRERLLYAIADVAERAAFRLTERRRGNR